jgi:ferrous iron transport protein A
MPLALVKIGEQCIVKNFTCSCDVRMRMVNMGFIPGRSIVVVNRVNGTVLVQLGQSRLMIDGCLATQIRVS